MKLCPNCKKENGFRTFEGPVKVRGVNVTGRGVQCGACGEIIFSAAELEAQETAAAALFVKRGIRTGEEFKLVRKVAQLKANEVADLLAVRPETVSRWERGEVEIPRAVAFALGELYERPRVIREKLQAFSVLLDRELSQNKRSRASENVRKLAKKLSSSTRSRQPKRNRQTEEKPQRKHSR